MGNDEARATAGVLRQGMSRLGRRLRAERVGYGLSLSRLSLLNLLARNGSMTASAMAAAERLQPQSLTRMLSRLENDGLIVRSPDDVDRRQVRIDITREGMAVLDEDTERREAWLAKAMAERLTPTECELLRLAAGLMERLADG
ncbi:MarR family transcriptional regulator [Actinoallomurus bryophytorum]|uniref:DNA-binding MarR family transcriptional regulator n=1 Tax=Actinoallomurus bryophytorum TaxID=1490222 RepID=A0A543CQM4_9ACTN|nr:MarR family transcriptional regulator [Actinoallomurus bryophytorum]TQL99405.1 DNA-binding MarR family transcriptional regulator [Actinoallomurus bryophytorum]